MSHSVPDEDWRDRALLWALNHQMRKTMDNMAVALLLRDVSENAAKYLAARDSKAP